MAKRSRSPKMEPAVMTMVFNTGTVAPGATDSVTIDLSQCASILNRRFYRQGINWAVAGFKVASLAPAASVLVKKLPNTWVVSGSWEKSMRAWLRQQQQSLDALDDPEPARYRDYKIHADGTHVTAGFATNLLPKDAGGNQFLAGEWESSQIVIPNDGAVGTTNEYVLHMVGGNVAGSKCLIQGYANSRNTPHSPDPVAPTPLDNNFYNDMFNVGDNMDDVINNATDKNDDLPYDRDDYPGETANGGDLQWHDFAYITNTTIGGVTHLKGGNFPCGLVRLDLAVDVTAPTSANFVIQVDLVPGNHRGYLCEPMTEM